MVSVMETIFGKELPTLIPINETLPRVGKWVVVVTRSFQTLGFLDPEGVWRDVRLGNRIDNVQSWHRLFDPPSGQIAERRRPTQCRLPDTLSNEIAV